MPRNPDILDVRDSIRAARELCARVERKSPLRDYVAELLRFAFDAIDDGGAPEPGAPGSIVPRPGDGPFVTDRQICALRTEAVRAGDTKQFRICDDALSGSADARQECARVIADARAQD